MHMGAAAIIARNSKKNFIHVVLNNGCHESVGGQPTVGFEVSLTEVAKACGYSRIGLVTTKNEIHEFFREDFSQQVAFLEIRINSSSRANLGRPVDSALSNKKKFENQIGNKG